MPKSYVPVPDGYIIWRDNDGLYSVAVKPVPIRGGLHSRTQAADYLYRMLGVKRLNESAKQFAAFISERQKETSDHAVQS